MPHIHHLTTRTRFLPFVTVLLVVSAIVTIISVGAVYRSSLNAEQARLVELVRSQVRFINAVAQFDAQFSASDHLGGSAAATLSQFVDALSRQQGFGESGEFVLGRRDGDDIAFLLQPRHSEQASPPIPIDSTQAEPMRRALMGQSGVLTGYDYRSQTVLAAHEPIPRLGVGLVAKIDLAEFRAPFIAAGAISCVVALFSIVLGGLLLRQIEELVPKRRTAGGRIDDVSGISAREHLIYFVLITAIIAAVVTVTSVATLYISSYESAKTYLSETAEATSRLIDAVARFDAQFSSQDHPEGARGATMSQVLAAMNEQAGFGETGEFVLGRRDGDDIAFLTQPRHLPGAIPAIHMTALAAKPMQRALMGEKGVLVGLDYRSVEVLAAYETVPQLNIGLVVKVDLSEVRAPFLRASLLSALAALVMIVLGASFLSRSQSVQGNVPTRTMALDAGLEERVSPFLVTFVVGLAAAVFALDLVTPLGVAGGVLYVAVVLAGRWFPTRRHIVFLAALATFGTIAGYMFAPQGGVAWIVLANRAYALFAIWVTAWIVSLGKASQIARTRQAEELMQLSLAVENSPSSVIITDRDGVIEYVNRKFTETTQFENSEAVGGNMRLLKSGETPVEVYHDLWRTVAAGREWRGEFYNRKKNGELYWEAAAILPILSPQGEIIHYLALQEDISERKRAEEQLRHMANHDTLTGLPTRRLGMEHVSSALAAARRDSSKAAVLFIDLDGFKAVNDTLGHEAGDRLLVGVAERLSSCVREIDTVARIGGDEFMVVINSIGNRENVALVAQKLIDALAQPFTLGDDTAAIGASVGIALFPDHEQDPEALIRRADGAMYDVKAKGKNSFAFAEDA